MIVLILLVSFILGVQGGVVDLQMCSGTWNDVIDYTVYEIVLYNNSAHKDNLATSQCHCDLSTDEALNKLAIQSLSNIGICYDWVRLTFGKSSVDFNCQTDTERNLSVTGSRQIGLTLMKSTEPGKNSGPITPVKIKLDPPQNSLRISCNTEILGTSPTSHTTALSESQMSTTSAPHPSTQPNATTVVPEASSEANYTLLVVGLVGLGVIAGSCIVCAIICRHRRNAKRLSGATYPKERFHQTVYRATSNMVKSIINKRPLPRVPMSLRRTKKGQMSPFRDTGLYDSIKSQRECVEGKTKPNPEVTPQLSNGSSIYIHPVSDNYVTPISFTPGRSTECTGDTYLTTVILHENGNTGQSSGRPGGVADDNIYVEAEKHDVETDDSYVYASTGGSRARMQEQKGVANLPNDDRTGVQDSEYMSMDHCSERNKDRSFLNGDTSPQEIVKDQSLYSTPHCDKLPVTGNGNTDNTFPQILEYQSPHEDNLRDKSVNEEKRQKPKRYIRATNDKHLSS